MKPSSNGRKQAVVIRYNCFTSNREKDMCYITSSALKPVCRHYPVAHINAALKSKTVALQSPSQLPLLSLRVVFLSLDS